MSLFEMESYIQTARKALSSILRKEGKAGGLTYARKCLEKCCSEFEELTLVENLEEEYQLYLDEVAYERIAL